jgi:hypothetical protein
MAAVKQGGAGMVAEILGRRLPTTDSLAMSGIARAVTKVARVYAAREDAASVVSIIESVPKAAPAVAVTLLDGIAQSWPEEKSPQLSDAQRSALSAAARGAPTEVAEAFGRVAARWKLPDVFRSP